MISLLLLGLAFSMAIEAEDSTGIRLGTTHFGTSPRPMSNNDSAQPSSQTKPLGTITKPYYYRDNRPDDSTSRVDRHHYSAEKSFSPPPSEINYRHHHQPRVIYSSPVYWITPSYYVEPELYAPRSDTSVRRITGNSYDGINYRRQPKAPEFAHVDPWAALGKYQIEQALDVFEWQLQDRPYAALPRVGYALSVALAGDLDQGAMMMDEALSGNVSDLNYFRSSDDLDLILEELLLNYQDDAFMTSSLLYLRQNFEGAEQAANQALADCGNCASARQLKDLIQKQL